MPIVPPTLRASTRDLPAVPPLAQYLIGCFLAPILVWVETALMRLDAWLTVHSLAALFDDVLAFLAVVDPEDPTTTPQIVDTFAMASPAAPSPGPDHLLRHLTRRLVAQWSTEAPAAVQAAIP